MVLPEPGAPMITYQGKSYRLCAGLRRCCVSVADGFFEAFAKSCRASAEAPAPARH